ncbi:MAG TPA: hypothetical protein ENI22_02690 [Candidatus Pacearchaeota archaeon]|nr:hypothetical protein [Candidatus Pacearchaeota archaeon]
MTFRKIFASNILFLLAAIIFFIVGVRYYISADTIGAILSFAIVVLFLIGYIRQIKYNKPKRKK